MLLLPVKVKVTSDLHVPAKCLISLGESSPASYRGAGNLVLMGIKNVAFHVTYHLVLSHISDIAGGTTAYHGSVRCMMRRDGGDLPEGVYSLHEMPACRLAYFGGHWKLQFS